MKFLTLIFAVSICFVGAKRFDCDIKEAQTEVRAGSGTGNEAVASCTTGLQLVDCHCHGNLCAGSIIETRNGQDVCVAKKATGEEEIDAVALCQKSHLTCQTDVDDLPIISCPTGYKLTECLLRSVGQVNPAPSSQTDSPLPGDCSTSTPCPACRLTAKCVLEAASTVLETESSDAKIGYFKQSTTNLDDLEMCSSTLNATICQGSTGHLKCHFGGVLEITSAFYGRGIDNVCLNGNVNTAWCSYQDALSVVRGLCNGKTTCAVNAGSPPFLPDPCPLNYKYVLISFRCCRPCSAEKTQTACHGSSLRLTCPSGYLNDVTGAVYGRPLPWICSSGSTTTRCDNLGALQIVQNRCQDQEDCTVRADTPVHFPVDTCAPTGRSYLQVTRRCCNKCVRQDDAVACEGTTAQLRCEVGKKIRVLYASYGRQSVTVCPRSPIQNPACHSVNSLAVVKQNCDGKEWCQVLASDSVFGDPCFNVYKYLSVQYECCKPHVPIEDENKCQIETVDVFPNVDGCEASRPLRVRQCRGGCRSRADYGLGHFLRQSCECCLPEELEQRQATIICKNGQVKYLAYRDVVSCKCDPCCDE